MKKKRERENKRMGKKDTADGKRAPSCHMQWACLMPAGWLVTAPGRGGRMALGEGAELR